MSSTRELPASPIVYLAGEIKTAEITEFLEVLNFSHAQLPAGKPITINMSTEGGECDAGMMVISEMARIQGEGRKVNVHVSGYAYSMGAYILQQGSRRSIDAHGTVMIHAIRWPAHDQTSIEMHRDRLAIDGHIDKELLRFLVARTGKPEAYYLRKRDRRDWYLTAKEALAEGLVDMVRPRVLVPRQRPRPKR